MAKNRDLSKFPNAITVLDNGNVGIGNSNPGTTLHISTTNGIRLQYPGNTGYTQFSTDGSNAYIFSGYDGERMRITSAGDVGIANSSPRARLDVGGAIMTLYQASTIADKAAGFFCQSTSSGLTTGFGFVIQDGFSFQGDNTGNNRKLSVRKPTTNGSLGDLVAYIDSAVGNSYFAGRMERTGQPSFQAHRTAGENQSITAGVDTNIIIFNGTIHNTGSHYNTANGRFTAPVTGRYMFASTSRFDGTTSGTYIRLYFTINGASGGSASYTFGHVIAGPSGYSSNYHSLNTTAVLSLNSGDYVEVRAYLNSGSSGIQYESQFSGFLI